MNRLVSQIAVWVFLCLVSVAKGSSDMGTFLSRNPFASGSSEYNKWFALSNIVDGNNSTDGDGCHCCAATLKEHDPWIMVDLGTLYRIGTVELFARTEKPQYFAGMNIFIHKSKQNWETYFERKGTVLSTAEDPHYFRFTLDEPVMSRYVTLQIDSFTLLVMCEIKVYSGACSAGTYGIYCNESCGHCQVGETCDHVTGSCSRCAAGYTGPTCKYQCKSGTFGQNCASTCGNCSGQCDVTTGECPDGCQSGYQGSHCAEKCKSGTFGKNCASTCGNCSGQCDVTTGECPDGCLPGYQGSHCDEKCPPGSYGQKCASMCGNCSGQCDVTTGECPDGCLPGYQGSHCDETCQLGVFGDHCSARCHCLENLPCDHVTGQCPYNKCDFGWHGNNCSLALKKDVRSDSHEENESSITAVAVGITVAMICALVVVAGIILLRRRRAHAGGKERSNSAAFRSESRMTGPSTVHIDFNDGTSSPPVYAQVKKTEKNKPNPAPDHEYYSFVPRRIRVCDLWDYIHRDRDNDYKIMHAEFEVIKKCPTFPMSVAGLDANVKKNRYRGLYAYDHTRVRLERTNPDKSDYINASYIDGFERKNKFIASQGPTKLMVDDFWLMVYQQKCSMIVMLTKLFENEERKCIQYWPIKEEIRFGDIRVRLLREEEEADFVIRYLEITKTDGHRLSVSQYHFKAWPDKDVPDNVWCLVHFWRALNAAAASVETPIVVHCSAGIGRTGTFIALDNMFYQAQARGDVSPFEVARQLREQRIKMIQTQDQYIFLHDVIAEALLVGTEPIKSSRFDELYTFMNTPDISIGSRYGLQLKLIEDSLTSTKAHRQIETEYPNVATRIDDEGIIQVQIEGYRLPTPTGASYIPMISGSKACIISPSPNTKTVELFWNLINKLEIRTVVMATSPEERDYQIPLSLGVTEHLCIGNIRVKLLTDKDSSTTTTFALSANTGQTELTVKQFKIPDFSKGPRTLSEARAVAALLNPIIDWNSKHSSSGPILVHCSAGSSAHGVIVVALNEVLRMNRKDHVINIMQSVKTMKQANRNIINKKDDLKFIYDVMRAYIHLDDVYQNV